MQSHAKLHGVTPSHVESRKVTQSHAESRKVTWSHAKSYGVIQTHTKSCGVMQSHTKSYRVMQSHAESCRVMKPDSKALTFPNIRPNQVHTFENRGDLNIFQMEAYNFILFLNTKFSANFDFFQRNPRLYGKKRYSLLLR
jgi:hypothetical protein